MFRPLNDPDRQSNLDGADLGEADRLFALAMHGQRFEDISPEEDESPSRRLMQDSDDG